MAITLSPQETEEVLNSIGQFFTSELNHPMTGLEARQILRFVLLEIASLAYNRGVKDAEAALRRSLEDLPALCFEAERGWSTEQRGKRSR